MSRYFLELAYFGKDFHGWQKQPNGVTIQETLENTLSTLLRFPVALTGAGRTDAGVHASYFVAHFDGDGELPMEENVLVQKLNGMLPSAITIFSVSRVADDAHSRFNAIRRTYEYHLTLQKNPFLAHLAYRPWFVPNLEIMNQAAEKLKDYSDFTSFARLHGGNKTNICTIEEAFWERRNNRCVFVISADRFLRNMVRAVVGTLLDVGRGRVSVDRFCEIIEAKSRGQAGTSAPSHGLYLTDIRYPDDVFVRKADTLLDF
ncbi:tRNA pseudouridine(38-40) synthase TruA [Thermophagus sp. OGC60D27]|uniref:tRNA pseudouridine(38-40) synthase TruA n=1 Tax=Thermophagus sp. OGC60D27 TaxID=3458415 RepID=UPI004037B619